MRTTVKDIMTTGVVSVTPRTPFKDVAETLIAHAVSAVPVLDGDGRVIGVVSEADLLRKEEFREQYYREGYKPPLKVRLRHRDARDKAAGDTAADLMTAPAVTIPRDATVTQAVRIMDERDVKRLVVVDGDGCLAGIVSRRDVLKVFTRDDADIAREIREQVLERGLWVNTGRVRVDVAHGVVTLSGRMNRRSEADIAVRLTRRVNGVVDVVDELTWAEDDDRAWAGR
ncbi:CBS domain-containing protein [Thermoactinospora rubra]|uniref:CBS domain-containing protein n=1 Tax=Thermoactinospora rubra TaxID=1088767 RepID=UPI000A0FB23B|nr:CBS domain-containing protein [Thermoactinospora rubra]